MTLRSSLSVAVLVPAFFATTVVDGAAAQADAASLAAQTDEVFAQAQPTVPPPNVVLIVADYMGYSDIGPYGADDIRTPALDRLAEEGVRLTDFYAAGPICGPSRAALLTGLYPQRVAVERNPREDEGLSPSYTTLARWLNDAGNATALFGKWHLGSQPEFGPNAHGFDEFLGFHAWTIGYYTHRTQGGQPALYRNLRVVERDGYLTDVLTDEAIGFIERNKDRPFFVYLAYNAALPPYQPPSLPKRDWGKGWNVDEATREDYVQMVEALDAGIGRVLRTLDALELGERTLVIFTYDHGGRHLVRSQPLFHGFGTLWEGGIRVPMILRWPGGLPANRTVSQPAISMDITATILDVVGLERWTEGLDGISLLPILRGEREGRERIFFWRTNFPRQKAVRQGRWKYIVDGGTQLLFDLETDISERRNLFFAHPDVAARLRSALEKWEAALPDDEPRGAEDHLGTLEVGKLADIVLFDANPLEDIKNTQRIWRVIKGGWVFDPEELRPQRN